MTKPTYKDLQNRVKDLEELLGLDAKPSKMEEIEALEVETMVKVKDLINACETVTGRPIEACAIEKRFSLAAKESTTPLRAMVEELRDYAMNSGKYTFNNDYCLAKWVFDKLNS